MKKIRLLTLSTIVALVVIALYFTASDKEVSIENTYPASQSYELEPATSLGPKTQAGKYDVEGFVVDTYECPLCPVGSLCKPCAGNSVTLSEKVGMPGIVVIVNDTRLFEIGAKYRFSVESSGPDNYPNLRLIGFDLLSETK